ncbi:MAG: hypothetical protein HYT80_02550 [Euryarchaeota archaeon]|nr:hypothetical protein [Euryarchaeota archaeon]
MTGAARATIRAACVSVRDAEAILGAIAADDDAQCTTRLEATTVVAELVAPDVRSLLRAADDVLACLAVAEDVIKKP